MALCDVTADNVARSEIYSWLQHQNPLVNLVVSDQHLGEGVTQPIQELGHGRGPVARIGKYLKDEVLASDLC